MRFLNHDLVPYGKFAPSLRLADSYVSATSGPRLGPGGIFVGLLSSGTPGRLIHMSRGVTPSSCTFFSGSPSEKNYQVKHARLGVVLGWVIDREVDSGCARVRKSVHKRLMLVCEDSLDPRRID